MHAGRSRPALRAYCRVMSFSLSSAAVDVARRTQCRLVNFGVAAVARVTGEAADDLLELRCECGAAACSERIRIGGSMYMAMTEADLLVVSLLHALDTAQPCDGWFAVTQANEEVDPVALAPSRAGTPPRRPADVYS